VFIDCSNTTIKNEQNLLSRCHMLFISHTITFIITNSNSFIGQDHLKVKVSMSHGIKRNTKMEELKFLISNDVTVIKYVVN